jgi:hypothetical protein
MTSAYDGLVERCHEAFLVAWGSGGKRDTTYKAELRAVLAEVLRTLETVTPEMHTAWHETPCGGTSGFGVLAEGWRAMLRASPLVHRSPL